MTAVFDYCLLDYCLLIDKTPGFQATYFSRFINAASGTKEQYYSNGGGLKLRPI